MESDYPLNYSSQDCFQVQVSGFDYSVIDQADDILSLPSCTTETTSTSFAEMCNPLAIQQDIEVNSNDEVNSYASSLSVERNTHTKIIDMYQNSTENIMHYAHFPTPICELSYLGHSFDIDSAGTSQSDGEAYYPAPVAPFAGGHQYNYVTSLSGECHSAWGAFRGESTTAIEDLPVSRKAASHSEYNTSEASYSEPPNGHPSAIWDFSLWQCMQPAASSIQKSVAIPNHAQNRSTSIASTAGSDQCPVAETFLTLINFVDPRHGALYEDTGVPSIIPFESNGKQGVRLPEFVRGRPYKIPDLDNPNELVMTTHQMKITYRLLWPERDVFAEQMNTHKFGDIMGQSRRYFAQQVAKLVKDATMSNGGRFLRLHGRDIACDELYLIEIRRVSVGAWSPILAYAQIALPCFS
ncbi:hypothetical protein BC629DRAFT_1594316 [Irpex lacteus]|nr:hypothetical protein BC629DRAFT_1594316 [Irpex lacteus]